MGTRKKGSELVFNLQWRNMPDNGGDRSNVVGMYDTPATTLNFDTFKSYLLKNSGVVGNDVKVTYLTDNGAEWVIDSQEWFEIALCAFRLKARLGEVIFLKLDKISSSNHPPMTRKNSNDVETQIDNATSASNLEAPPEWFLTYMKQFKRDVVEEVTYAVSVNLNGNSKEKEIPPPAPQVVSSSSKKVKSESSKRSRKHMMLGENPIDKELLKTLKFDRKLEIKLDKLDAKTKKIKEKKQALISKLENEEHEMHHKHCQNPTGGDGAPLMNASLVSDAGIIPHMMGGETYLHSWEVYNSGKLPWTSKTEVRLTWGSADMKPCTNVIRCPPLRPGEKGTICVRFQIPQKPGQYESYWNFYDRDVRFGQWLSCGVIVDGPVTYLEKGINKKAKIEQQEQQKQPFNVNTEMFLTPCGLQYCATPKVCTHFGEGFCCKTIANMNNAESGVENTGGSANNVIDLSRRMQDIKIVGNSQVDSDSDWESLWSYAGAARKQKDTEEKAPTEEEPRKTNKYGINEKDLIVDLSTTKESKPPSPKQSPTVQQQLEAVEKEISKIVEQNRSSSDDNNNGASVNNNSSGESICEIGSDASSDLSSGYDVINSPVCEEKEETGYVYITIDGNKLPVPKHILRPDFLASAEEAPGPVNTEDDDNQTVTDAAVEEKPNVPKEQPTCTAKLESQTNEFEQEAKSFMSHCSAAGTCFSDLNSSFNTNGHRLFIFPQNNPGFEVIYPKLEKEVPEEEAPCCPSIRVEAMPGCQWNNPEVPYAWSEIRSSCMSPHAVHMRYDPYGPLDQSRPTSCQGAAAASGFQHVPNYQQSIPKVPPPEFIPKPSPPQFKQKTPSAPPQQQSPPPQQQTPSPQQQNPSSPGQNMSTPVHILPENLVSGAVNVASSAINTARSVINMIVPPKAEPGKWINGHWVTENVESTRAKNLCILADMGFWDADLNATLLARYNDDITKVVSELLQ